MNEYDRQLIMAYYDGELNPEQVIHAKALLEKNADAQKWLAGLEAADKFVQKGLAGIMNQPVPERLLSVKGTASQPNGRLLHFPIARLPSVRSFAMAASLMLFLAGSIWLDLSPKDNSQQQQLVSSFVAHALESVSSGTRITHPEEDDVVMPLATYQTKTGQFCRTYAGQFEGARVSGLACRSAANKWTTVVEQTIDAAPVDTSSETYRPATGASDIVTPALDNLELKNALPSLREEALLQNNWR